VFTKFNKEEYLNFIHDPKHMINPPEAILFENSFCERFTKTPWYMIPILWGPLIMYYLAISWSLDISLFTYLSFYVTGLFLWTFTEYILHRFIFHYDDKLPDNNIALMAHFLFHGIHHAFPMDKNRLVFPPVAAYPLYRGIKFLTWVFFGNVHTLVIAGILTGYIFYDLTHYFIHHTKPAIKYFAGLKQYHVLHHYNNPKLGFGVSNKLWDFVFGTVLEIKTENIETSK